MPQLDFSTYIPQLFWFFVLFSLILVFSAKKTLPRLQRIFDQRWQLIEGALSEARKTQEEADLIARDFENELKLARKQSHDKILSLSRDLSTHLNHKKMELSFHTKERFKDHEIRILEKKASAMGDVRLIAFDLARSLVNGALEATVGEKVIEETVHSLIKKRAINNV